ncbi:hypothetical protein WR25_02595 [Diploscapter pachys]|uniref:RRM domain-containing protein n=1 Tax=Diploscapter pachys TaxID=2018661 RepID=A0A2A2LAL3_9BILA|nr:hypothetical protein WR25_02595 [Diploscapter pachys]
MGSASKEECTLYVTNLTEQVTADILEELFTQIGPVEKVKIQEKNGVKYSFVEFSDDESVLFACEMMDGTELYSKAIVVKPRSKTNNEKIWEEKKRQATIVPSPSKPATFSGHPPPSLPPPRPMYDEKFDRLPEFGRYESQSHSRGRSSYLDDGYGAMSSSRQREQRKSWDGRNQPGQTQSQGDQRSRDWQNRQEWGDRRSNERNWNNPRDMDFRERADRNRPSSGYGNDDSRRGQWSDQRDYRSNDRGRDYGNFTPRRGGPRRN